MPVPRNLQVLIPYKDLEALLAAAGQLPVLLKELQDCRDQISALRSIQTETLEKYSELYHMI